MKIGIGCTTYLRPECLVKWKQQIAKYTIMDNVLIYIADDSIERKGVAYRKNECLRALKDCDYVFLFDDDCYPVNDGWIENFIKHPYGHLLYCNEKSHRLYLEANDTNIFMDCGGVFMFMDKECIEKVGAFNEKFETWGFEHAEYSLRYCKAKGYPLQFAYQSLKNTSEYIYSEDYSNLNHKSSITNEEKDLLFKKNFPIFVKGVEHIYIAL